MNTRILTEGNRKIIVDVDTLRKSFTPTKNIWDGNYNHNSVNGFSWKFYDIMRYVEIIAKNKIDIFHFLPVKDGFFKEDKIIIADTGLRLCDLGKFKSRKKLQLAVLTVSNMDTLKHAYGIKINDSDIAKEDFYNRNVAVLTMVEKTTRKKPIDNMQKTLKSFNGICI